MRLSFRRGFSFGLTSAVITTLGLIVGLDSSTGSKLVVISGILTIALADSFSDALGIHMSVESENKYSSKVVWESTISTLFSKLLITLTFLVPFLIFNLQLALWSSIFWGFFLLILFSYKIARAQKINPSKVILEHSFIALLVLVLSFYLGNFLAKLIN